MGHFLFYFWDSFLYSIQPISIWNDKIFGLGSKKKVCNALICHHTLIWGGRGFLYKILQVTPLMASSYEFGVYMYVNVLKILIFESVMKIGRCVFLKMDILGQNLVRGRFSRFFARYFSFAFLKWNLSILSSLVCPQCSLEHSFGCHHWIVHE